MWSVSEEEEAVATSALFAGVARYDKANGQSTSGSIENSKTLSDRNVKLMRRNIEQLVNSFPSPHSDPRLAKINYKLKHDGIHSSHVSLLCLHGFGAHIPVCTTFVISVFSPVSTFGLRWSLIDWPFQCRRLCFRLVCYLLLHSKSIPLSSLERQSHLHQCSDHRPSTRQLIFADGHAWFLRPQHYLGRACDESVSGVSSNRRYGPHCTDRVDARLGPIGQCSKLERNGLGQHWGYGVLVCQQASVLVRFL